MSQKNTVLFITPVPVFLLQRHRQHIVKSFGHAAKNFAAHLARNNVTSDGGYWKRKEKALASVLREHLLLQSYRVYSRLLPGEEAAEYPDPQQEDFMIQGRLVFQVLDPQVQARPVLPRTFATAFIDSNILPVQDERAGCFFLPPKESSPVTVCIRPDTRKIALVGEGAGQFEKTVKERSISLRDLQDDVKNAADSLFFRERGWNIPKGIRRDRCRVKEALPNGEQRTRYQQASLFAPA